MPADHILTYARDLSGGGVERAQLRLVAGWVAAGRRVTLVLGSTAGPLAAELPRGAAVIDRGDASMRALLALPAIVARLAPDLLFCPGNQYTGIAAWTRLRLGRGTPPIIGKMSNAPHRGDHGRLLDLAHRAWLGVHGRFLDHLVAMTPGTAAAAARALRIDGRVSVIPNPPAPPGSGPAPALPPGRVLLGVGRLARQKRWDRLVAAMPGLPADIAVVILGEGPLRAALTAQADRLGVAARLHLPGHVADPLGAMAQATAMVLPSDFEGVPGVLREALSVGTPVIATDCSAAIAEIVTAPALGNIVPRDDPGALAGALAHWLHPAAVRPAPVAPPGADAAARYLALFDRLVRS